MKIYNIYKYKNIKIYKNIRQSSKRKVNCTNSCVFVLGHTQYQEQFQFHC